MNETTKPSAVNCRYCGNETSLYINGLPVCVACCNLLEAGKKPPSGEPSPNDASSAHTA